LKSWLHVRIAFWTSLRIYGLKEALDIPGVIDCHYRLQVTR